METRTHLPPSSGGALNLTRLFAVEEEGASDLTEGGDELLELVLR